VQHRIEVPDRTEVRQPRFERRRQEFDQQQEEQDDE